MEPDSSPSDPQLGRILLERGIVTEAAMREVISLQRQLELEQRGPTPRLGELLVQKGYATADQIRDALAVQNRKILYCPKCQLHVNVDLRPDVLVYRCGRCETALVEPPTGSQIKVVESTIMFVVRDPLPSEVQARLQDPAAKFGKYIIVSELGRGGVGVVHKAWDTYLGQFVALKRLRHVSGPKGDTVRETHIASLLKEARSAVRLRHPHICTVYDVGRIGREFYMALEYLEGRTLARDVQDARARGRISPFYEASKRYLRCFRDVARALHYAHTRPSAVIHCDLKPSNVFLDTSDRAYVLDFGLARNLRSIEEPTGSVSGTPSYMAPEQASGHTEDIDARTDVYGLGAILYELLTGRPPFLGSVQSVLRKALSEMPERPEDVLAAGLAGAHGNHIPPGLEELCLRCLEKDRAMRFQSAHEVADAVDRILKGDSQTAARPSPGAVTPDVQPAPKFPAPPTAPGSPPRPSSLPAPRAQKLLMFIAGAAVAALIIGAIALVSYLTDRETRPSEPSGPPRTLQQLIDHAIAFRPDLALGECGTMLAASKDAAERARLEALRDEFQWMEIARARLIESVERAQPRPKFPQFRMRDRTVAEAEILKAAPGGLVLFADGKPIETFWSEVAPSQVFEMADRCLPSPGAPERLGLALYARRVDLKERSRGLLDSLKGTELEAAAARYREP